MKKKNRGAIEKERRKLKEKDLVEQMEAERSKRIEKLRSAKPVPTPDWFVHGNHEVMQSRAPANPVRKGFNRTVGGRKTEWIKLGALKAGAEKTASEPPSGKNGSGDRECPPLRDVDVEQPAGGCDELSQMDKTHDLKT